MDWSAERLAINRKVRRVLVSHFIDLGRMAFNVYPGKVAFRGTLERVPGAPDELAPDMVRAIFDEIVSCHESLTKVTTQFDNWRQEGARSWVPMSTQSGHKKQRYVANLLVHPSMASSGPQEAFTIGAPDQMGADTSNQPYKSK